MSSDPAPGPESHAPGAGTVVAAVIGDPIRHSRSPAIFNAAFEEAGLDWTYVAFEVPRGGAGAAVEAMRTLGLGGLSVTMPHKEAVVSSLDALDPAAERLGAVNCIERRGSELVGHNTDGAGFLAGLSAGGVDPGGARCVVLGAGGAARAVVLALHGAGAADVVVVNRTPGRALEAAALAGSAGRVAAPESLGGELERADLLVNATPVGMGPADPSPVRAGEMHDGLFVSELIYDPHPTALMEAATAAGAATAGGLGMLVGQAAVAFRIWTGEEPPVDAMRAAAAGAGR